MLKACTKCGEEKDEAEGFHLRDRLKNSRRSICKSCCSAHKKEHYRKNKDRCKAQIREYKQGSRLEVREKTFEHLRENPCVDCGESDILVLEFDHVRGLKKYNICDMMRGSFSWKSVQKEIEKCEVVCANCHKRRTAKRFGSWRLFWPSDPNG